MRRVEADNEPLRAARRTAVSLFTGAGIGDVGFRASGFEFLAMAEIDPRRAELASRNFPGADVIVGDLWERGHEVVASAKERLAERDEELFFLACTAPCQGMSKNGQGTLLRNARLGKRPKLDPRNRLILPALDVISELTPQWVCFENVSEMANTIIEDKEGNLALILDIIERELGAIGYRGKAYDIEFADYGVPQRRRRLITVYTCSAPGLAHLAEGGELIPPATHSGQPESGLKPWVTVEQAIGRFPPLDAGRPETASDPSVPFHRVPLLDGKKYIWVSNTPPTRSAFDNQCATCGYDRNPIHGAARGSDGVNRAKQTTPIFCERCHELLPRPHVVGNNGKPRIMRGYTSAYKRMAGGLPAPALTRNLSYACSDQKLHPTQNRVLSLAEAFELHSLTRYDYHWGPLEASHRKVAPDGVIRLVLGESVPPAIFELIGTHLIGLESGAAIPPQGPQPSLLAETFIGDG